LPATGSGATRIACLDQAQGDGHRSLLRRRLHGGEDTEEIVLSDPGNGIYKKLVLKEDRLIGSVLYGDTVDGAFYFTLVREKRNVAEIRER
jgi:NAD(P)H-nitrite reductase large subunit